MERSGDRKTTPSGCLGPPNTIVPQISFDDFMESEGQSDGTMRTEHMVCEKPEGSKRASQS